MVKEYIFSGRVQGVGFRYFTREVALNLGLRGSVRNLADGNVLVVVDYSNLGATQVTDSSNGKNQAVKNKRSKVSSLENNLEKKFLSHLKKGNGLSEVREAKIRELKVNAELNKVDGFEIIY